MCSSSWRHQRRSASASGGEHEHAQPCRARSAQSQRQGARTIEALLGLAATGQPLRLPEVGTGAGGIARYFGARPGSRFEVDAVDVNDTRQIRDGYRFARVTDAQLPFPDDQFDVVISNHVTEHVGDLEAQRKHPAELHRVLNADGVAYLAVPNR